MKRWNEPLSDGAALGLAAALLAASPGCVGYRLGSMLPEGVKTVYVPTFVNRTGEPLVEVDTTRAAIAEVQKDGSLRIAGEAEADSVLEVTLTGYELTPLSYDRTDRTLANEYRVTLTAAVALRKKDTGKVLAEHPRVRGETTFPFTSDLTTAKRQALPEAAKDLAHDIVEMLVETW